MQITLYNFSKKANSTKQPTNGTSFSDINLKEETSFFKPTFQLAENPMNYNYAKWDKYYYYITDKRYVNYGVYEIDCDIDVLATYKSNILDTNAFVVYSTNNYNDGIIDTRLSTVDSVSVTSSSVSTGFNTSGGECIVSLIASNGALFAMSTSQVDALVKSLCTDNMLVSLLTDTADYLSKIVNSATDCIRGCFWTPIKCTRTSTETIILGKDYDTGLSGGIPIASMSNSVEISIPWQFSDFRNRSQFTSLILYLPGYGMIELNADDVISQSSIEITIVYIPSSGDLSYKVGNLAICQCNVSSPYGINMGGSTQSSGAIANAIGGLTSTAMNFASGNVAMGVASGFNTILSNINRSVGNCGGAGASASFNTSNQIILYSIAHDTNVAPSSIASRYGRPYNGVLYLGNCSGYVQCCNASVSTENKEFSDEINSMLNGGVFIE